MGSPLRFDSCLFERVSATHQESSDSEICMDAWLLLRGDVLKWLGDDGLVEKLKSEGWTVPDLGRGGLTPHVFSMGSP